MNKEPYTGQIKASGGEIVKSEVSGCFEYSLALDKFDHTYNLLKVRVDLNPLILKVRKLNDKENEAK
jgi:hypothetical protein